MKKTLRKLKTRIRLHAMEKSKWFDKGWYAKTYPEAAGNEAEHYYDRGWRMLYDPSPLFSTADYLEKNPDVAEADTNPLLHYIQYGMRERRPGGPEYSDYRTEHWARGLRRRLGRVHNRQLVKKNNGARILVILHLYYMNSWKEIREYLMNLDTYGYDLLVTYTTDTARPETLSAIKAFKPDARLLECENRGYDLGPYLDALQTVDTEAYDILFKLHSKGVGRNQTFIYGNYMRKRDWFLALYEGCLGAFTVHRTVDKLMDTGSGVGLCGAKHLITEDLSFKKNMVLAYMQELGMPLPQTYRFVAGTCFGMRANLAREVQQLHLSAADFNPAGRGFSSAHKMERILCLSVLNQGYTLYGNDVLRLRRCIRRLSPEVYKRKRFSGLRLLEDDRFTLDAEFVFFRLEHTLVRKYELVELPLSEIRRSWCGQLLTLEECHPYRYLVTGDEALYRQYLAENIQYYNLDIMSLERFTALIEAMKDTDYDPRRPIVVNEQNILMDGQHRACILLYKYGGDYKLPILRISLYSEEPPLQKMRQSLRRLLPAR